MTRDTRNRILTFSIAFALPCGLSAISFLLCGPSLALIFAGFFILTPILPAMLLTQSRRIDQLLIGAISTIGIFVIWMFGFTFSQFLQCAIVLITYAILLAGFALVLVRIRFNPLFSNALVTIAALAWLTWPIWLVPNLPDSHVNSVANFLIRFHPLFAINGVLKNFGDWSHWPIAYRNLTTLGQNIPYSLPTSIIPTCAVHGTVGIALILLSEASSQLSIYRSRGRKSAEAVSGDSRPRLR